MTNALVCAPPAPVASSSALGGAAVRIHEFVETEGSDGKAVKARGARLSEQDPSVAHIVSRGRWLVSANVASQVLSGHWLVVACGPSAGHKSNAILSKLQARLGGKGGGNASLAQGRVPTRLSASVVVDALCK